MVGDTFIVCQCRDDALNVVMLGIEQEFSFVEQLVSRHEVADHSLVVDGGAGDCLALVYGGSVAYKELVPRLFALLLHAWV